VILSYSKLIPKISPEITVALMRLPMFTLAAALLGLSGVVFAAGGPLAQLDDVVAQPQLSIERVRDQLARQVGRPPDTLRPSTTPGLWEAQWGTQFAYVTADGLYVIYGDLVSLENDEEITDNKRRADRLKALAQIGVDNMIEFAPAPPARTKYVVYVFTDMDCGPCRALHREIDQYNALGIAVRYVFFPRTGPETDAFKKAVAVWCSSNHKLALTRATAGAPLLGSPQCVNPVRREYELGQTLGINGTPFLVLPNGAVVSGYIPPDVLMARITAAEKQAQAAR
jgi:thiol:disulfide interchange protein DsbC